jgi:uracil-DNA glycosylase
MSDTRKEIVNFLRQIGEDETELILDRPLPDLTRKTKSNSQTVKQQTITPYMTEAKNKQSSQQALSAINGLTTLEQLNKIVSNCASCSLSESRKNVVFGVGNQQAELMFVGEAPGADEDRQGEPFVGRAGQLLNKIIQAMDMKREDVFIANILKCRPPGNRNPSQSEADTCFPYLFKQIEIIAPKLIVALGLVAATHLLKLEKGTTLKSLRKQAFMYRGRPLMVTYHPAALLRNPALKRPAWEDMQRAMKYLSGELEWKANS